MHVEARSDRGYNEPPAVAGLLEGVRGRPGERLGLDRPAGEKGAWNWRRDGAKALLALALLALAVYIGVSRYTAAVVDWYLGNLHRNPGDEASLARLAAMGDRALPRLEQELQAPDPDARLVAVLALAVVPGEAAENLLVYAAQDADPITAANAVAALGHRTGASSARGVLFSLESGNPDIRLAARRAASRRFGFPWWSFGRVLRGK